ncbi:RagB/SusD family nutrient uptake outer membrane protein [Flavobacterium sp. P4023]|uniref:RagB/SusD family nutrient uptake outer membrane protein n=1 Tax=Flavobacterium flabelliforme TaxID=2816119 RepID=A0ABS5CNN8_9FLAO|nr:RagB/SusD family nutrient uptake outer membrane protein [Flavobacterium flabelliforme]MBP4140232.1 RagB/SusD family nutrient uptake outer membrane protein [Flavobacterium flabelliforme]
MKNITKYILLFITVVAVTSCDNYLDVKPVGKVIPETLNDFRAVLTKGYEVYPQHKSLTSLRGDELMLNEYSDDLVYYKDIYIWKDANPDRLTTDFQYQQLYNVIFYSNVVINEASKKVSDSPEKNQLIGEAHALRAMAYFDLINLFAKPYNPATAPTDKGVPLALKIDLEQAYVPESVAAIYNQIQLDKEQAKSLLNIETQVKGINYRFSKAALYAFESRIYLYQKEWSKALEAVNNALAYKNELVNLNTKSVLPNNYDTAESILALEDTFINSLKSASYVSVDLIAAFNKQTDLRFPIYFLVNGSRFKFKKGGELNQKSSFRTAELYLTKAETLNEVNNLAAAKTTILTFIEKRYTAAGFDQLTLEINAMDKVALSNFISQERQREFTVEGHRWFDLRRASQKQIVHMLDGTSYTLTQNDPRYTLPFPANVRLNNPDL